MKSSNTFTNFTKDAQETTSEISDFTESLTDDDADIWEAREWLFYSSPLVVHWPEGVPLDIASTELEASKESCCTYGEVVIGSMRKALLEEALECFEDIPERLRENHVEALLSEKLISAEEANEWILEHVKVRP